ncbi:MAG: NAD(P)/FAD-dependent oxidoreductase [Clostridium sp.]|nr:NAD(P)/FAD-dependent oxidoreductase [Clostridium sp.]
MMYDVIIIGGGPAGMYTALTLSEKGHKNILILDMNDELGGTLNEIIEVDESYELAGYTGVEMADDLKRNLILHGVDYEISSFVLSSDKEKRLKVLSPDKGLREVKGKALVFATGARERPRGILNFTTKRTSGIFSVGTARKFIVEQGYLPGNRVVIFGSDWTGLYLAKLLMIEGADEVTIVDQVKELNFPDEELAHLHEIYNIKTELGYTIREIHGSNRITGVTIQRIGGKVDGPIETKEISCDTVLLSVGLTPQRELFKKFRRNPEKQGVFVTGNADKITFDLRELRQRANETAEKVLSYLEALE